MSLRNRLAALALAVGATLSLGLAAAPAATAASTTTKTFDISGSTSLRCDFGDPGSSGNCPIAWGSPYSEEWRVHADDRERIGAFRFTAGEPTTVTVSKVTPEGRRIFVEGTIPNRGSADFTITKFDDPYFGSVAAGQKLNLRVERTRSLTDTFTHIYLNGHLNVSSAPTSGNGGGGLLSGLGGLFGSS